MDVANEINLIEIGKILSDLTIATIIEGIMNLMKEDNLISFLNN